MPVALPLIDEPVVDLLQLQASLFNKLGLIILLYQQNKNTFDATIIDLLMHTYTTLKTIVI